MPLDFGPAPGLVRFTVRVEETEGDSCLPGAVLWWGGDAAHQATQCSQGLLEKLGGYPHAPLAMYQEQQIRGGPLQLGTHASGETTGHVEW